MTIEEVVEYRFLVKNWNVQTIEGINFEPGDDFFTKNGEWLTEQDLELPCSRELCNHCYLHLSDDED